MSSAMVALAETRASCCSSHALSASTRGLLRSWRAARRSSALRPRIVFLDCVQSRDALECFAGDRCGTALGDVIEAAPQVGPAKRQRDRFIAHAVGNSLIGHVPIALYDAAIAIEQLERVHRAPTGGIGVGDRGRIGAAPGSIIARNRPEEAFLGATPAGIKHWRRSLV